MFNIFPNVKVKGLFFFCFLPNMYALRSLSLGLVDDFSIYLRSADIAVGKHFADCIDVNTFIKQQGSVGVAEAVECNMLADARFFNPALQFLLHKSISQPLENLFLSLWPAKLVGLIGNWNC